IADVTATAEVERVVASVHQRWGRLDVVVNNAGITGGSRLTWEVSDEEWQRVLAVDLTSVFLVSRAAVRIMLGQGSGRIVNIASIAGKEGNPTLVPYSTAKAGVIGFTKALAKEVATRGILVNAVAPAVIGTEMVQQMSREALEGQKRVRSSKRPARYPPSSRSSRCAAARGSSPATAPPPGSSHDITPGRCRNWPTSKTWASSTNGSTPTVTPTWRTG